tara:strand:+ start:2703 stop:2924 length:222 start_codon:yes stop_codon:yes gene_type:complete
MTKKEVKRINQLLNEAASASVQGDMATERGDHSKALQYLDKETNAMVALYEEFGITDGAHESRIKYSKARDAA